MSKSPLPPRSDPIGALIEEFSNRCWKLLREQGVPLNDAGTSIQADTKRLAVELGYTTAGTEFFTVTLVDPAGCRLRRIYRATNGVPGLWRTNDIKTELEHLRREMVLEDLADA